MANDPYERMDEVPALTVASTDVTDEGQLADAQRSGIMDAGGSDISPQLSWSGAPEGTLSYAVTCYDPDAPTGSGFWHWVVADIPSSVTELARGAGDEGGADLPEGAFQLGNDAGSKRFIGAAPPAGHGSHRYYFTVYALDVESLGIDGDASPAFHGFNMFGHTLARGHIMATSES